MPPETREPADDVLGPVLVHLEEVAVVDDTADDLVHVVRLVWVVGDERAELPRFPVTRIRRLRERSRIQVVLREEREQVARVFEAGLLVGRNEVRNTRLRRVSRTAAERLEPHLL